MENYDSILQTAEKSLKILGGIFDNEKIENKLSELEKISSKENFGKIKT